MPINSARRCAVELLVQIIDQKRPFDEAIVRHTGIALLEERDRNFTRHLVLTTLRKLGQIDNVLKQMLSKPLKGKNTVVMHSLRLGVVQLLWLETPPHAAVNETINTAVDLGAASMKGLINAVLKRVSREGKAIIAGQDAIKLTIPDWIFSSWCNAYGEATARAIAASGQNVAPLDITVKDHAQSWAEKLGGTVLFNQQVRITDAGRVEHLPGYLEGQWWVQDAASALPVQLLGDIHGKVVFDVCAAPGGKTAQLVHAGADVIAIDKSKRRLEILAANFARLALKVRSIESDILKWHPSLTPDIILLDAPCSATGTFRRHPEVLYHRSQADIVELVALQQKMLQRCAGWLEKNGLLVYCVCSLQPEEGEMQIAAFIKQNPEFAIKKVTGTLAVFADGQGALRIHSQSCNLEGGIDGFYVVLLEKTL